jgi:hypothetical protein
MTRAAGMALVVAMAFASSAGAQSGRGTIGGVVTDETGAVLPLVEVTATHQDTNVATTVTSNDRGLYSILNLPIGRYTVSFQREGFNTLIREGITIALSANVVLDVQLGIGGLADVMTVTADASLLGKANAEIGTNMTSRVVTDLPLNISGGRALENFAYSITPSVEGNNWESRIAGSPPFSKEVVIDGTSAVIQIGGHIGESSPPMEAVEEFRVQTSGIAAEYGRTGGGVFSFSLKSGTNQLSGSAYGYMRNEAFNANTRQNNFLAASNPDRADEYRTASDRQYIGGVSVGAPIFKDRTFVFGSYEDYQQQRFLLGAFDRTVPIPAFLDGDFSALLDTSTMLGRDPAGNPIYSGAILDPHTGLVFPGNIIPSSRISAVSRKITDIYRQSYQPLLGGRLINNSAIPFYNNPSFKQHQFSVKVDHNLSAGSRLSGSMIWTQRPRTLVDSGGIWDANDPDKMGGPLSRARHQDVGSRQARLSHSQTLASNLLHVVSVNYSRYRNPSLAGSADGNWPATLGFGDVGVGNFPQIGFGPAVNGVSTTNIGYSSSGAYVGESYLVNSGLSWVQNRHVFKFGGEFRHMQMHSMPGQGMLNFVFSNAQTGAPTQPWANRVGFGFASFLLGEAQSASQAVGGDLFGRRNYISLYAQDDFRVSDRLTLNLGLRWETTGPWTEKEGRWANFDTRVINPVRGVPGALVFAEDGNTTFEGKREWTQFGPRAGLAYQITPRAVFRSAYGLFYMPVGMDYWSGVPYGFAPGYTGVNTVTQRPLGVPAFNWDNGYPGQFVPGTRDPNSTQWGLVSINPNGLRAGRIHQWNAGTDLEIGRDLVLGVNYLGNRGTDMQSGDLERNQPDPEALRQLLRAGNEWAWVSDPASAAAAGVPYPHAGFANFAFFALMPYVQASEGWGPLFFVGSPLGSKDYHAMQLTLEKRMSRGVAANAAYTLSRARGNTASAFQERWSVGPLQDVTKLGEEARVIDAADRTHVFKGYVAWELPVGRGRRFMNNANSALEALVGGWTVSAIFRYQSGQPLRILSRNSYTGWSTFGYPIYVNADPNGNFDRQFNAGNFDQANPQAEGNRYFDPAAFSNPPYGELGKGPGSFKQLRGFGGAYEDFGIMKNVRFANRYQAQIRFEMINLFNRGYFANPVTDIGSALFGQVVSTTGQPRQGQLGVRFTW